MKKASEFQCPECDAPPFSRPNGLSRHRSQAHGVVSPTAAKQSKAGPTPRGRPRTGRAAPTARAPGSVDFAEPIETTITRFERHAGELEARAKKIRDALAVLRETA